MKTGNRAEISHSPLSDQVSVILQDTPELALPLKLEEEVEVIWQREKAKSNLYNSFLFSLTSYDEHRLVGRFVEYRYFVACRHLRELQDLLQIFPLGVSGICLCKDKVLVGVRDTKLLSYPGFLECVPSGSIEARAYMHGEIDFVAQAMWELSEEAKIGENKVKEVHQLGLYYCPQEGMYDLGLLLRVDLQEPEMDIDGTAEYPLLNWYGFEEFDQKLQSETKVVPLTRALWHTFQK